MIEMSQNYRLFFYWKGERYWTEMQKLFITN